MSLPQKPFGSVCRLVNGKAFKATDWSKSGAPIIRIQNLNGSDKPFNYWAGALDKQVIVNTGDLLLAWSGTPGTSFGAHIWGGPNGVLNQHIFRCDLNENAITKKWARIAVNHRLHRLIEQAHGGVGLQHVTRGMVEELEIPLPPIEEQRRIAAVLDNADELRTKRRAALAELDTLTQSIFLEMFGDPRKRGSKGGTATKERLMGELTRIRTGKLDANAADENGAHPFFTCAVEPLRINTPAFDCKAVLVAGNGDLNVKYYEGKFNAYQRTYVIESVDEEILEPKFLHAFLDLYVGELRKQAIGGVIKYIKLPYLTEAVVQLPSLSAQQDFVRRVTAVENLKANQRTALTELDDLFASLQHRAFRGEL